MSLFTEKNPDCEPCEYKSNLEVLRSIPCFSGLQVEQLKVLAFVCERLKYKEGELFFEQDEKDENAYYLLAGSAQVIRSREGEETVLGSLAPGDFVGGLALINPSRRLFSIRAESDTTCLIFNRHKILPRLNKDIRVYQDFVSAVAETVVKWEETNLINRGAGELSLETAGVSLL